MPLIRASSNAPLKWASSTRPPTLYPGIDTTYRDSVRRYALLGVDVGVPIIKTSLLGLEIYGQAGAVADSNLFGHQTVGVSARQALV